jgi:pimeloyl-ACP methyl ester carboxylesterase
MTHGANRVHMLVKQLGLGKAAVVVHGIGLMVALPNTGHWVMDESPQATMEALVAFLNPSTTTTPAM